MHTVPAACKRMRGGSSPPCGNLSKAEACSLSLACRLAEQSPCRGAGDLEPGLSRRLVGEGGFGAGTRLPSGGRFKVLRCGIHPAQTRYCCNLVFMLLLQAYAPRTALHLCSVRPSACARRIRHTEYVIGGVPGQCLCPVWRAGWWGDRRSGGGKETHRHSGL